MLGDPPFGVPSLCEICPNFGRPRILPFLELLEFSAISCKGLAVSGKAKTHRCGSKTRRLGEADVGLGTWHASRAPGRGAPSAGRSVQRGGRLRPPGVSLRSGAVEPPGPGKQISGMCVAAGFSGILFGWLVQGGANRKPSACC